MGPIRTVPRRAEATRRPVLTPTSSSWIRRGSSWWRAEAGERVYVYRIGERLELASIYQCPLGTGPRHCAFDNKGRMFMTCEFSSELWSFDFDTSTGVLKFIDKQTTLAGFTGRNEPATLDSSNGRFVYMNNRGEDTIVW